MANFTLSVKAGMGNRGTERGKCWERGESAWECGEQGGNDGNAGNQGGNDGSQDENAGNARNQGGNDFFSILCLTSIYKIYNIRNLVIVIYTPIYILIQIDGSYNEK